VIVRRHVIGIESGGAAQIGARSRKLPQREFAVAALGVEVCTACKRNGARNFGAGLDGNGLSGGRCSSEN
jgi:hypothetical protein